MARILLALAAVLFLSAALADDYVRGYTRRDGTYVQPHMRSSPNEYRYDNYSGRGNTNPYTGERGSQRHEFTNPPAYNTGRGLGSSPRAPDSIYDNPYGGGRSPSRNRF